MKQNTKPSHNLALQSWLRPALTPVLKNRDFDRFVEDLQQLDRSLRKSCVESLAVDLSMEDLPQEANAAQRRRRGEFALYALRVELLRHLLGCPSFEAFSMTLASSDLLTDFCGCRTLDGIRWTSKSSLHRASTVFSPRQLRQLNTLLVEVVGNQEFCFEVGLEDAADLSVCLIDSTCLPANIHFPVDWVLLKDVTVSLLKATALIRREGLLCRMPDSTAQLLKAMNRLCIEMTHSRRKPDSRKTKKAILRRMKKLLSRCGRHARRHCELLRQSYYQTRLSPRQARGIIEKMEDKLGLLPRVIAQAHERIIGARQIRNTDKILSIHERDIDVIVRGKAGAQVEFGNELFLAESPSGLIIDYKLYAKGAPCESRKMIESLKRQQALHVDVDLKAVVADRGYDTRRAAVNLQKEQIQNHICPRHPAGMAKRLKDPEFRQWQTRRATTEARIAILKNHGAGRVWRAKGLQNRKRVVAWSVLAHNCAWIARKVREQEIEAPPIAA